MNAEPMLHFTFVQGPLQIFHAFIEGLGPLFSRPTFHGGEQTAQIGEKGRLRQLSCQTSRRGRSLLRTPVEEGRQRRGLPSNETEHDDVAVWPGIVEAPSRMWAEIEQFVYGFALKLPGGSFHPS